MVKCTFNMAVNVETLRSSGGGAEKFGPEKKAAKWFAIGGFIGAVIAGIPGALLGAFGAGAISWRQARFGNPSAS